MITVEEAPVPNYIHANLSLKEAKLKTFELQTRSSIQTL